MTQPRRIVLGQTHVITRRCEGRKFMLRPSPTVNAVVEYALAFAAERHGIEVHGLIVHVNHYHIVVTDPCGALPAFVADFDVTVARQLNLHYLRGEAFWRQGSYSNVEIHDAATLLAKLVYVMANVVKDGLVATPEEWPGLRTLPEDVGVRDVVVMRPVVQPLRTRRGVRALRAAASLAATRPPADTSRSRLPESARLVFTVPRLLTDAGLTPEQVRARLRRDLDAKVASVRARRQARGLPYGTPDSARHLDPMSSPGKTFPDFKLNPRIACGRRGLRIHLIRGLIKFRKLYRAAFAAWRNGDHQQVFPRGTYSMRVVHRVRVADPAPSPP